VPGNDPGRARVESKNLIQNKRLQHDLVDCLAGSRSRYKVAGAPAI
jgi:hypothetical protein